MMQMLYDKRPHGIAILDRLRWNRVGFAIATAVIYIALDEISYVYPLQSLNITPWSPDRSLVVALILFYGAAWVIWVYLTIFVAELVVTGARVSLTDAAALAAALTCAYAAIAYLIRSPLRIRLDLPRRSDVLRLALAVIVGAVGASVLYVGALLLIGAIEPQNVFRALFRFWIGDATGMLVTLPLLLMLVFGWLWRLVLWTRFLARTWFNSIPFVSTWSTAGMLSGNPCSRMWLCSARNSS